jgi:hypothetical protein
MRFHALSCSQNNIILVTISVIAIPEASNISPVINQEIKNVSIVPVTRQEIALARLLVEESDKLSQSH